jgi:predicted transcriptional regulator
MANLKGLTHHQEEEPKHMKVEDVMTTRVIMVTENQTKQQAARLLAQHRISGLPVVNDDHAERSDTDGSFNAFVNAPVIPLRAEDMMRRGIQRKERKENESICDESYRASGVHGETYPPRWSR